MTKYKLIKTDTIVINGTTLYRIELTEDHIRWGKAGTLGGYVQSMANLFDDAFVFDNAHVYGNARVSDNAHIYGNARVSEDIVLSGDILVQQFPQIEKHLK